jgi:AcrR family transcriptional regulator
MAERAQKYDEKLDRILKAAATVFAREGYDRASIRLVAEEAEVSVPGLYYYVRSKEELLYLIQYHVFDDLADKYRAETEAVTCPKQRLAVFVSNHLERFLAHISELVVCSRELDRLEGDFRQKIEAKHRDYFGLAHAVFCDLAREYGAGSVSPRTAALAMFGSINWIFTWYRPDSTPPAAKLAEDFVQLYLQGFLPSAASAPAR